MYEKLMYKVESKDNKVVYRVQDFTKNDNVDESVFVEGENSKGAKRLQCQVKVLHVNEYEAIIEKLEQANLKVDELNNNIMQKNVKINKLENEIKENKREHESQLLQIANKKFKLVDELNNKNMKLEKQHQIELDELKETHENELRTIDKTHAETLKKMRSHYTRKLDDANERLLNEVKANDKAGDKLRGEMLDLKETHKQEVITLQSEHHRELETIQHQHADELQDLRKQHAYDIDQLKQAIATIKQEHLTEVNEIERGHNAEVEQIRSSFMKVLASEHAQDLSDLNECEVLPFYVKPFAKAHMKKLDEFKKRKYMNTPQKIVESYTLLKDGEG